MKIQNIMLVSAVGRLFPVAVLLLAGSMVTQASAAGQVVGQVTHSRIYSLDVGVSGEVSKVTVSPADRVTEGTLLLQLGQAALVAAVDAAAASVAYQKAVRDEANRAFERDNQLFDEGSLSAVELDLRRIETLSAESDYRHSVAVHRKSSSNLSQSEISAPEAGVVLNIYSHPGERINLQSRNGPAILFGSNQLVVTATVNPETDTLPTLGAMVELVAGDTTMSGTVQSFLPTESGEMTLTVTPDGSLPAAGSLVTINY